VVFGAGLAWLTLHAAPAVAAPVLTPVSTPTHLAGALVDAQFFSPTLGRAVPYRVYLPPDYTSSARLYPVLYMLHGVGGDYTEWTIDHLPERADELVQRGAMQPMLVVMPDARGRSYWANWPDNGPRWADYLATDVVHEIDTHFRTLPLAAGRAVGGLSMGGLGALNSALHHPDVFGAVGGHSPSIRPEPDFRLLPTLSGESFDEHNPSWLIQHRWRPGQALSIWLDVGLSDPYRGYVENFNQLLVERTIPAALHEFAGGHEGAYWSEHAADYLSFYSQAMRLDPGPPPASLERFGGLASENPS
jgi:enterochelin esterase-like enzyme